MNVLEKLSIKNLNLNKKRTTSTVIGIILSCALICAVATMVTSFQASLVQNAISETGYYHLSISNVTKEDIKQLENNRDINEIYSMSEVGYANLKNSKNEYKPYLKVLSMDEPTFEYLKFKLVEGRFPTNDNEIVISEHIITDGEVEYKIGDQITLDIGERKTLDGYDLSSSNPYNKDDEELVNTTSKEFTIVGIIERPDNSFEGYGDPSYTTITTGIDTETKDVYISLKNPRDYKTSISEILGASEYDDIAKDENLKYTDFNINDELLRWEVFAFSDNTISMLYAMSGIVIFIIIFTSVFCIRNSFAISTTEKIKMYGMLASIGATKKQIRKSVIFEAMLIGLIGIPIGILSGILADYVLICIVNNLLGEFLFNNIDGIILKVSGFAIILSIVLSIITIYLSAISSARKASKVSPIENLKGTDEIKINAKKLKVPKIISKVFKTGGVLAYKNLKRSKKKYRTTVISLTVSIFIFIAMNSFITNMFGLTDLYYTDYDYNLIFYGTEVSNEEINQIVSLEDVEEYFLLYRNGANLLRITDTSKINEYDNIPLDEDYYFDEQTQENVYTGEESSDIIICALDDVSFKKYAEKIGANYEDIKSSGILYDTCMYYSEDTKNTQIVRRYKYKENDTIIGKYGKDELSIKVGAVADIGPYGIENSYYDGGYLIVDIDEYKDMNWELYLVSINSDNPDSLEDQIKNITTKTNITNLDENARAERAMILVVKIFLYGFIAVITLIGVTNIFNTITSNMELRQKEFASLKSIGMTKKEFNRMINLETIFYCTKALAYGIILGLIGTFAMYKAASMKIDSGIYIPYTAIIISIVFVFILVFAIMRFSMSKINKQNIIETIRNENI